MSIQEKERKEKKNESEQKNEKNIKENKKEKNKKVSAFAKKREVESDLMAKEQLLVLMYKDVYFTIDLNSSLLVRFFPCYINLLMFFQKKFHMDYLLQEVLSIKLTSLLVLHFQIDQSIGQVQKKQSRFKGNLMSSCRGDF